MTCNYDDLRKELDDLGYYELLLPQTVPLVQKLLEDLNETTTNLRKFMKIAQKSIEERDTVKLRTDVLWQQNTDLKTQIKSQQKELTEYKQKNRQIISNLKQQIDKYKTDLHDSNLEIDKLENLQTINPSIPTKSMTNLQSDQIENLTKINKQLNDERLELLKKLEIYECQLNNRGKNTGQNRQTKSSKNCCHKEINEKMNNFRDRINTMGKEKNCLEKRLKETIEKQHEAMKRALHLAERNKQLENELKDIDKLALAVEHDCNNTMKSNNVEVNRLKQSMTSNQIQLQQFERENNRLKCDKQQLENDLNLLNGEKKKLQTLLDDEVDDKRKLVDKINHFNIIEKDLNLEIDRLTKLSGEQKQKILELEYKKNDNKTTRIPSPKRTQIKNNRKFGTVNDKNRPESIVPPSARPDSAPNDKCKACCSDSSNHLKELLDKEIEYRELQSQRCIENLKSEKDYYMKAYHKLIEQMQMDKTPTGEKIIDLMQKLNEKEKQYIQLENTNKLLSEEKYTLMQRIENLREKSDKDMNGSCSKMHCKRVEREKDLLQMDVTRLQDELKNLRQNLEKMNANEIGETSRLKSALQDCEEKCRQLEAERRQLLYSDSSRHSRLDDMEEKCGCLQDKLRQTQNELAQHKAQYNQLKILHEQSEGALEDSRQRATQIECQLTQALEKLKLKEKCECESEKQVEILRNDLKIMKTQLAQMDREKDELLITLDDKTEKYVKIEGELHDKTMKCIEFEAKIGELMKKSSKFNEDAMSKDLKIRNQEIEIENLKQELDAIRRLKENMMHENRRYQDELATMTCDMREARNELEANRREIDDLKRLLQQYVAEVKRTEDLISAKEIERNQLLDQFRSLSQEANQLENNNHTLENVATQSKVQLSVALDHANELETTIINQTTMLKNYEKQIGELTNQIASLEFQLKQTRQQQARMDQEIERMKSQMEQQTDRRML